MVIYDTTPPSTQASSPAELVALTFEIQWEGDDGDLGVGMDHFEVQFKEGQNGEWTDWITHTIETSTMFTATYRLMPDAVYFFRSRGVDIVGHVENWPDDLNGDTMTILHFPTSFPGKYKLYLPVVSQNYSSGEARPDLLVESLDVELNESGWNVFITVRNDGDALLPNGVWMDLYIDPIPERLPIEANETFDRLCINGATWWIPQLLPGESVTLSKDHIAPVWLPWFPSNLTPGNHILYVQIDSFDDIHTPPNEWARVYEWDETNNVFGPVDVQVVELMSISAAQEMPAHIPERLPPQ
jgi:hypothetical protein